MFSSAITSALPKVKQQHESSGDSEDRQSCCSMSTKTTSEVKRKRRATATSPVIKSRKRPFKEHTSFQIQRAAGITNPDALFECSSDTDVITIESAESETFGSSKQPLTTPFLLSQACKKALDISVQLKDAVDITKELLFLSAAYNQDKSSIAVSLKYDRKNYSPGYESIRPLCEVLRRLFQNAENLAESLCMITSTVHANIKLYDDVE